MQCPLRPRRLCRTWVASSWIPRHSWGFCQGICVIHCQTQMNSLCTSQKVSSHSHRLSLSIWSNSTVVHTGRRRMLSLQPRSGLSVRQIRNVRYTQALLVRWSCGRSPMHRYFVGSLFLNYKRGPKKRRRHVLAVSADTKCTHQPTNKRKKPPSGTRVLDLDKKNKS